MNEVKIKIGELELTVDEAKELYQQLKTVLVDEQRMTCYPSCDECDPWSQSAIGSIDYWV